MICNNKGEVRYLTVVVGLMPFNQKRKIFHLKVNLALASPLPSTSNALLNARRHRDRVNFPQSHSVRDEFLNSEDAVAVTHSVC